MIEHEEYVLSSLLQDNTVFYDVCNIVTADDFTTNDTKQTYTAIEKLISDSGRCDFMTVQDLITSTGGTVSALWISKLSSVAPSPGSAVYHANKLRDTTVRRKLRVIGLNLAEQVKDVSKDAQELLISAEKDILSINESIGVDYIEAKKLTGAAITRIEERFKAKGDYTGVPCGIGAIDNLLNGFQRQEVTVVGARASIGKTALGLTIAANVARAEPAGFFSLEMSNKAILDRLLSMYGNISSSKIRRGNLSEVDFSSLHIAGEYLDNAKLFLYDKPSARLLDIRQKARRLKQLEDIQLLVIDYVGLIKSEARDLPRHLQISESSKAVKELARELDIPILLLAQINRSGEGKSPSLAELKESGALEEDADVVILLHRDRENNSPIQDTEIVVAKNRNGPTGKDTIGFQKQYTRFVNMQSTSR